MEETNQNNQFAYRHTHDGINSPLLSNKAITKALGAPKSALTAADNSSLTSSDSAVIGNIRTRVAEIEARLQSLGLIS